VIFRLGFGTKNIFLDTTFFYFVPYGFLAFLGCNFFRMSRRSRIFVAIFAFAIFFAKFFFYRFSSGSFQLVQIEKYPPRMYYLAYGTGCSFALLLLCEKFRLKIYDSAPVKFVSMHSMWIYLHHIFALTLYDFLRLPKKWYVKLIFVYVFASLAVLAVNKILDFAEKHKKFAFTNYLRG
jgi:hypothetical protein